MKDALEDLFICPLLHLGDRPAQLDRILVNVIGGTDLGIAKVNEIMTQVAKRFGSREDIVFGAVIDESRSQSLELCILGKAEMDAVAAPAPEPSTKKTITTVLGLETEISQDNQFSKPVHRSKLSGKRSSPMSTKTSSPSSITMPSAATLKRPTATNTMTKTSMCPPSCAEGSR